MKFLAPVLPGEEVAIRRAAAAGRAGALRVPARPASRAARHGAAGVTAGGPPGRASAAAPPAARLMLWITLHLGWPVARAILLGISAYFFLAAPTGARRLARLPGPRARARPPRARDVFRHIHAFASVIMESVFLLSGRDRAPSTCAWRGSTRCGGRWQGARAACCSARISAVSRCCAPWARQAPVPVRPVMFREQPWLRDPS